MFLLAYRKLSLNFSYLSLESGIFFANTGNHSSFLRSAKRLSKSFINLKSSTFEEHAENDSLPYWTPETLFQLSSQTFFNPDWCCPAGSWEQFRSVNGYPLDFPQNSLWSCLLVFSCFSEGKKNKQRWELNSLVLFRMN